jgi:hypothetical protein
MKSSIDINMDTQVSKKKFGDFLKVDLYYCCKVELSLCNVLIRELFFVTSE